MLIDVAAVILSSDDWIGWVLLAGPVGATAFYWSTWQSYRNTDKSHAFEHETDIVVSNLTGADDKVGTNNGTQERWVRGRNSHTPRVRIR